VAVCGFLVIALRSQVVIVASLLHYWLYAEIRGVFGTFVIQRFYMIGILALHPRSLVRLAFALGRLQRKS